MGIVSKIISYLFQPIFMPILGVYLLVSVDSSVFNESHPDAIKKILVLLAGLTVLMPLFSMYIMYNARLIADLELKRRKDRIPVFGMTLFYFGAAYYLLITNEVSQYVHPLVFSVLTGAMIAMAIAGVITIFWQVSIHMVGVAGVLGMFIALPRVIFHLNVELIVTLILLCGIVGSARMREGAHNLSQIFVGFLLGFGSMYLTVILEYSF